MRFLAIRIFSEITATWELHGGFTRVRMNFQKKEFVEQKPLYHYLLTAIRHET